VHPTPGDAHSQGWPRRLHLKILAKNPAVSNPLGEDFDYAEAFTVIDVNTGRFVGSRSKTSGARLEDTTPTNNPEAVKEVVRQLRLRDIGGIIVIDFIDMAHAGGKSAITGHLQTHLSYAGPCTLDTTKHCSR